MDLSCFGIEFEMCVRDLNKKFSFENLLEDYTNILEDISSKKNIPLDIIYTTDPEEADYGVWTVTTDASIDCNMPESKIINKPKEELGYAPIELVSPKTIYNPDEYGKFIQVLKDVILDSNLSYEVNKSQGMHINVSHPDQNKLNTLKAWWYFEPVIMSFVPPERRESKFAVQLRTIFQTIEDIEDNWEDFYYYPEVPPAKYTALCVKKNRFEFRLIPAFMEFENISAWLSFCVRFVFASIVKKIDYDDSTEDKFNELFEFLDVSQEYPIKSLKEFFYFKTIRTMKELRNFIRKYPGKKITEVTFELIQNVIASKNKKDIKFLASLNSIESIRPPPPLNSIKFLNFLAKVFVDIDWKKIFSNIEIYNVQGFENLGIFLSWNIPSVIFTESFVKDIEEKDRYDILDHLIKTNNKSLQKYLAENNNTWFFNYLINTHNLEKFELYLPLIKDGSDFYPSLIINKKLDFANKLLENNFPLEIRSLKDIDKNLISEFILLYINKFGKRDISKFINIVLYLEDVRIAKELARDIEKNISFYIKSVSSYEFLELFLTENFENKTVSNENAMPKLKMNLDQANKFFDFLINQFEKDKVSFNFIKGIFNDFFKNYEGNCTNNLLEKFYQFNMIINKKNFLFSLFNYGAKTLTPCQNKFLVENFDSSFADSFTKRITE